MKKIDHEVKIVYDENDPRCEDLAKIFLASICKRLKDDGKG